MIETEFNGETVYLLLHPANFGKSVEAEFSLLGFENHRQGGVEKRRVFTRQLRTTLGFTFWPEDDDSPAFQVASQQLKDSNVLVPFWPAWHTTAWRTGIWLTFEPDFSVYEVHTTDAPTGFVPSDDAARVPLLFGKFTKEVTRKSVGGRGFEATVEFADAGPAVYALASVAASGAVAGLALPSGFTPKIFPFLFDWTTVPETLDTVEIKREQIGYIREQAETYHEQPAVRALNIAVTETTADGLAALAAFFAERQGSVEPFWLPDAAACCILMEDTSLRSAVIQVDDAAGLGDNRYIFLQEVDGSAQELRQVVSVDTAANTLTLDRAPLSDHAAASTRIVRALLARFRAPEMKLAFASPSVGTAKLNFLEVPHELVGANGVLPFRAYLYRWVRHSGTVDIVARHTSNEIEVNIGGEVFLPRPIEHSEIIHSLDPEETVATVTAYEFDDNPLNLLVPNQLEVPLWLQIMECFPDANGIASTATVLCLGRVASATVSGSKLTAEIGSLLKQLSRLIPALTKKKSCNYSIYSPSCGVSKAAYTRTAVLGAHTGNTVALTEFSGADVAADWFAGGVAWLGDGLTYQSRNITASTASAEGALVLTVATPFTSAPTGSVSLAPQCNGSADHCKNRFGNWPKGLMFQWTPTSNPSLVSRTSTEQGGKK